MGSVSSISLPTISNFPILGLEDDALQNIFEKLDFPDLSQLMLVCTSFNKNIREMSKRRQFPLDYFLEQIEKPLKDLADEEILKHFHVCKYERTGRDISCLKDAVFLDLTGIKESLRFLISKLSNEQLCEAWTLWGQEYHNRELVELLANHYFDRLVPSEVLEGKTFDERVSYVSSILHKLNGYTPPTLGFISVGYERNCLDHDTFHGFYLNHIWQGFESKIEEQRKIAPHLFSDGVSAKLQSGFAWDYLFVKNDFEKTKEILNKYSDIIFHEYDCFDYIGFLSETAYGTLENGIRIEKEVFVKLKDFLESRDEDLAASAEEFIKNYDEIIEEYAEFIEDFEKDLKDVTMGELIPTSRCQFSEIPDDLLQLIFSNLPFSDLANVMPVSKKCLKNVCESLKFSQQPLDLFLEIIKKYLSVIPDEEVSKQFHVCKTERRGRNVSALKDANRVDLVGIKDSLAFLISKLSLEDFLDAWHLWAKEYQEGVLIEFLADQYLLKVIPKLSNEKDEEYRERITFKNSQFNYSLLGKYLCETPNFHPATLALASKALNFRGIDLYDFDKCFLHPYHKKMFRLKNEFDVDEGLCLAKHLFYGRASSFFINLITCHLLFYIKDFERAEKIWISHPSAFGLDQRTLMIIPDLDKEEICVSFPEMPTSEQLRRYCREIFSSLQETIDRFLHNYKVYT